MGVCRLYLHDNTPISRLETFIESKRERLTALREMAVSTGSPAMTGMPRNPSPSTSPMADAVCRAIDLEREIHTDEERLQKKKIYLLDLIGQIDNPEYQSVLISRYFQHQSWQDISAKLFYTDRWIYKLHGRALETLDKLLVEQEGVS